MSAAFYTAFISYKYPARRTLGHPTPGWRRPRSTDALRRTNCYDDQCRSNHYNGHWPVEGTATSTTTPTSVTTPIATTAATTTKVTQTRAMLTATTTSATMTTFIYSPIAT
ncbi:hypothetical protein F442_11483 [Phytophthora nicotianae P10297]|uniref:Uncharacterized protein n=2 Tax=Phytophthora nicotianae TaxID=4792 RepID=W2Z2R4_PHYNI|nr:hypothetical protein L915_11267 [Phytophthora nicotianae]ETP41340.1 hypothetical protein F442_11483 [Phytophthora nicotianae P10297]